MACKTSYPPQDKKTCRSILQAVDKRNPTIALMLEFMALTGLRVSDAGAMKKADILINGQIRKTIEVIQIKPYHKRLGCGIKPNVAREKSRLVVMINSQCREVIKDALSMAGESKLLFPSERIPTKPYSTQHVNTLLKTVAIELDLDFQLSTHSFRKAFALFLIEQNAKIHQIRDALGQSSLTSTDAYLKTFSNDVEKLVSHVEF